MKKTKTLRKQICDARAKAPQQYRRLVSYKISEQIGEMDVYKTARTVAGYIAINGECDPKPLLDRARQDGKLTFVPKIFDRNAPLKFAELTAQSKLVKSGFGLLEPDVSEADCVDGPSLDLILVPLVGFDEALNRLGMGGGYYDRTFATNLEKGNEGPTLIGIAYEQQKIASIETQEWDVPLDVIVTELRSYHGQG